MNRESEERELQQLFGDLRRAEAGRAPLFARVCQRLSARERTASTVVRWSAFGATLTAALLVVAAVVFRRPAPQSPQQARQPDAAALVAVALQTLSTWPEEPHPLSQWDSPTASLLASPADTLRQ